ncbi:LD-carboxypeptidase [Sphingobium boeckii]|uniref:Muramoyltetrapeptide carboxypeptidase n=1 Tax=Sphingobium boeckii TaxID=1082345 RepID=A0A7W9AHK0_9SPHN|nr:LD-carboxypeptidase [Sphingobium boeckii]MBB5685631.1 muramoyltetrapeptide carboxypeptidase [Sphingobium boeckii]
MRIGIVAPSCPIDDDVADGVTARAAALYGADAPALIFHPQCWLVDGHFAGNDATRLSALVEMANDPAIDAIWFARGGYGAGRIAADALPLLNDAARAKTWIGYSDAGVVLAALYAKGIGTVAHGPMPADIRREDGGAAVDRALRWLVERAPDTAEPHAPAAAFNLTILSHIIGTPLQPDLAGHVLMLEDVAEYHYRIDRALGHVTSNPGIRQVAGIRMGRFSDIPENDRPFGMEVETMVRHWCRVSGIPFLGTADIGHDAANMIVPFG